MRELRAAFARRAHSPTQQRERTPASAAIVSFVAVAQLPANGMFSHRQPANWQSLAIEIGSLETGLFVAQLSAPTRPAPQNKEPSASLMAPQKLSNLTERGPRWLRTRDVASIASAADFRCKLQALKCNLSMAAWAPHCRVSLEMPMGSIL